jgi:hypothetical protein
LYKTAYNPYLRINSTLLSNTNFRAKLFLQLPCPSPRLEPWLRDWTAPAVGAFTASQHAVRAGGILPARGGVWPKPSFD